VTDNAAAKSPIIRSTSVARIHQRTKPIYKVTTLQTLWISDNSLTIRGTTDHFVTRNLSYCSWNSRELTAVPVH